MEALSPERIDDYFHFFDEVAFSDNPSWSWCYCTFYHFGPDDEAALNGRGKEGIRDRARQYVREGTIQGYLAYDAENKVVGWVNVNRRANFKRLMLDAELAADGDSAAIRSIVCFIIAPALRGQGIATAMLRFICEDSARLGYQALEAYPIPGDFQMALHFHGPRSMYEKQGFALHRQAENYMVLRKYLDRDAASC